MTRTIQDMVTVLCYNLVTFLETLKERFIGAIL
jgi:hypothetical protein